MAEEFASLMERVLQYLADYPDGTRFVELERQFGTTRLELARVVRCLAREGKIEKRELRYFAV